MLRAAVISVVAAVFICGIKFAGFYLSGSVAILSDALESINNILTAAFALYSVHQSFRLADRDFLFGRGRLEYFSAGFEGGLIVLAGLLILYESVPRLWTGGQLQDLEAGMGLVLLAALLNGALGWYLIRVGRRHDSPALEADGRHVFTDLVTSVGVLAALVLVRVTGWTLLDPLVAVGLALWLLWTGYGITRDSFFQLMDRVAPETLAMVITALRARRRDDLVYPHRLRIREVGRRLLLDLHAYVPRYYTVEATHELETGFAAEVEQELGRELDFMMHIDPCRPDHCVLCAKSGCPVRARDQTFHVGWNEAGLLSEPGEREGRDYADLTPRATA